MFKKANTFRIVVTRNCGDREAWWNALAINSQFLLQKPSATPFPAANPQARLLH
jgi:hypothetical protein